jgi:hypothetical protein
MESTEPRRCLLHALTIVVDDSAGRSSSTPTDLR